MFEKGIEKKGTRWKALDEIYKIYICVFGEKRTDIENDILNLCIKYNTEEAKNEGNLIIQFYFTST